MYRPLKRRALAMAVAPVALFLSVNAAAAPTAVTDWAGFIESITATAPLLVDTNNDGIIDASLPGGPPVRARLNAMTHVAIHDALNSIQRRYASYSVIPGAGATASPQAAIAAAAYNVLAAEVPSKQVDISNKYLAALAPLGDCVTVGTPCSQGIKAGQTAAKAILATRNNDGSRKPHPQYAAPNVPGAYQPTPGANGLPIAPAFEQWGKVRPFALVSNTQFRPAPAGFLYVTSEDYVREYNEVKRVGAKNAPLAVRSAYDTETVMFWAGSAPAWSTFARKIVEADGSTDLWAQARLFALLNMALSDAGVAVFDAKYHYRYWRPITAIRRANDGNPITQQDATWDSLLVNPAYPDYTSGASINAGAAAEVLRRYYARDNLAFSHTANNVTRSFGSVSAAAASVANSRVLGGIHFRSACKIGLIQGEQIGRFVYLHYLKPLR
ncbi:MAG TPA: vanadium-dependent haloperoxidase [Pseudoxanthomonas sp.]